MRAKGLPAVEDLTALVEERAGDQAPATRLRVAIDVGRSLTEAGDALIGHFVAEARAGGLSWTEIGREFGTSKQAVQQRYGAAMDDVGPWPERWTPAANRALDRAADEARALGHDYVGTEHVLLALLATDSGIAGDALGELGVTRQRMLATPCMRARSDEQPPQERLALMPRVKQALEHGRRIADALEARPADTEHLLAGIVAVRDSMAVEVLRRLGVGAEDVCAALAQRLQVDPQRLGATRRRRRRLLGATR